MENPRPMHTPRLFASALLGATLLIAAALPAGSAEPVNSKNGQKFGKTLVAEYEVPADTLVKFAAFRASKPQAGESAIVNAAIADAWASSPIFPNLRPRPARKSP